MLGFVALIAVWLIASSLLARLIAHFGGPHTLRVTLGSADLNHEGPLELVVPFTKSLIVAAFCGIFARDVGYRRRDAIWAAIPSPAAPYFLFKIAWRFVNLPNNRYWDEPVTPTVEALVSPNN